MNNDKTKEKRAGFTPGEWTIRECPQGGHYEGGEDPFTISADGRFIASIKLQSRNTQANAHLIASAPELHAQAKLFERVLTELVEMGEADISERDKLREVLAKADGGAEG